MHGKEFVIDCVRTFFAVVTLINVVMLVMGLSIAPKEQFGYEAFLAPLLYGAVGTLPNVVMYSKKELKLKELLVRKAIQVVLIEVLVLFVAFYGADEFWQQPHIIAGVAISILLIYILVSVIDWLQNYFTAKHMTEDLMKFQESVKC